MVLISIVSSFVFDDEGRIHKSVDVLEKTDELEQNNKKKKERLNIYKENRNSYNTFVVKYNKYNMKF